MSSLLRRDARPIPAVARSTNPTAAFKFRRLASFFSAFSLRTLRLRVITLFSSPYLSPPTANPAQDFTSARFPGDDKVTV
jgi:hypothetical protein